MLYRTVLVCLTGLVLVKLIKTEIDPVEITFTIRSNKKTFHCDQHNETNKLKNIYTVLEGETMKIFVHHNSLINHLICHENDNIQNVFSFIGTSMKNVTTFNVEKRMGTVWNCTILTNRETPGIFPMVNYENIEYAAIYCFMKIHVRQKEAPQLILVNNMILPLVRTDLSEKYVDFTAEYYYVENDIVEVSCANLKSSGSLTMEYNMADALSDKYTSKNLSSHKEIGFVAKMHYGYNKTYMICTNSEKTDHTKVKVEFVMRTKTDVISIRINGMVLRPKIDEDKRNAEIEYKYIKNKLINVVCETKQSDTKLSLLNYEDFQIHVKGFHEEVTKGNMLNLSFHIEKPTEERFKCGAEWFDQYRKIESVFFKFIEGSSLIDILALKMELPAEGRVMELYINEKIRVIYYDFVVGETLNLTCRPDFTINPSEPQPPMYLQFRDTEVDNISAITKTIVLKHEHHNLETSCYLKEKNQEVSPKEVLREIRVIFREMEPTTTSSTTTTTTEGSTFNSTTGSDIAITEGLHTVPYAIPAAAAGAACIIIICVSAIIFKVKKRNHTQRGHRDPNYVNLPTPSETSIPPYPPQWDSNYAVPFDRRADDVTYSVPCTEPVVYSTAIPKSQRKQSQDPTYAILDVQNSKGRKNVFKDTENPNYSEIYANKPEQCYAKVVPKSIRKKMEENPYSYVTKEPSYANTEPEPMYCEPNVRPQKAQYENVNNKYYVNIPPSEYVQPTYCEPQKRGK